MTEKNINIFWKYYCILQEKTVENPDNNKILGRDTKDGKETTMPTSNKRQTYKKQRDYWRPRHETRQEAHVTGTPPDVWCQHQVKRHTHSWQSRHSWKRSRDTPINPSKNTLWCDLHWNSWRIDEVLIRYFSPEQVGKNERQEKKSTWSGRQHVDMRVTPSGRPQSVLPHLYRLLKSETQTTSLSMLQKKKKKKPIQNHHWLF